MPDYDSVLAGDEIEESQGKVQKNAEGKKAEHDTNIRSQVQKLVMQAKIQKGISKVKNSIPSCSKKVSSEKGCILFSLIF